VSTTATAGIELDPGEFSKCYDRRSMAVRHSLVGHPLLALDAIAELTASMPLAQMECNLGILPELHPDGKGPRVDASTMRDVVRTIEENGNWVGFHRVEVVPEYRVLLEELLDPIAATVPPMGMREAYLFLSGAGSVTPCHRDPEHNFLLQVRGRKQVTAGDYRDDEARELALERAYRMPDAYAEHLPENPVSYALGPGDGVYLAPDMLHLVHNADDVSISFSVTWRPDDLVRAGRVYQVNGWLRDHGRAPTPPGRSVVLDRVKARLVWVRLFAHRVFGRRVLGRAR
jgi:hypothetical protein